MDQQMYTTVLQAAHQILQQNKNTVGIPFAESFMAEHDPAQGAMSQRGVQQLANHVANETMRLNGSPRIQNDQQLFDIVGTYVFAVYNNFMARRGAGLNSGSPFGGGQSGFGGSSGFGGGFPSTSSGFGNSGGFNRGGFGTPSPTIGGGSHLMDETITPQQQTPPAAQQRQPSAPAAFDLSTNTTTTVSYSPNPLDDLGDNPVELNAVKSPITWGIHEPKDDSIVMFEKYDLKTKDERIVVKVCDGFELSYLNNPMDVVRDFFRVTPDSFLAEHFAFRIFYNHIETLEVSTEEFLEVRRKFIEAMNKSPSFYTHTAIITILNSMMFGPRTAIANYLVRHINRALYLSCGTSDQPALRIKFKEIEDLEELLGTSFQSKILDVPNAKGMIADIVNTAIVNALTGYSNVMFYDPSNSDIDVIRTSPAFPYKISGVYPSKDLIPMSGSDSAKAFYDAMYEHELSKRTYVRSIRSVVITNILGRKSLSAVGTLPTVINGQIPSLLNEFLLKHSTKLKSDNKCAMYDLQKSSDANEEYQKYITGDTALYETRLKSRVTDFEIPELPVDQSVFVVQYKKSPQEYLAAFDLLTTMNAPRNSGHTLMAIRNVTDLKVTQ